MPKQQASINRTDESAGRPRIEYGYAGAYQPTWATRQYDQGGAYGDVILQPDKSLTIRNTEWYVSPRTTIAREAWVTLTPEAARKLRDWLIANVKD
jgi:hypothetical protein